MIPRAKPESQQKPGAETQALLRAGLANKLHFFRFLFFPCHLVQRRLPGGEGLLAIHSFALL